MRDSLDPHSVSRWTELLINAETGQVPIRQFSFSGYATNRESAANRVLVVPSCRRSHGNTL
jgi:hypothetical protein